MVVHEDILIDLFQSCSHCSISISAFTLRAHLTIWSFTCSSSVNHFSSILYVFDKILEVSPVRMVSISVKCSLKPIFFLISGVQILYLEI